MFIDINLVFLYQTQYTKNMRLVSTKMSSFLKNRVKEPFRGLLKQGMSPEKLAETVVWGIIIGLLPLWGTTTVIAAVIAWALKLNLPAIQLVNYIIYPGQIILYIPFMQAGAWVLDQKIAIASIDKLRSILEHDWTQLFGELLYAHVYGIIAWVLFALLLFWPLRLVFNRIFSRFFH